MIFRSSELRNVILKALLWESEMETVANLDEIQFGFATKHQAVSNVTHQYHCSSQLVPSLDRREEVSNYVVTILINFLSHSNKYHHQAHSCARNTCFLPCTSSPPSNIQFSPSSLFFIIGHCLSLPSSTPGNSSPTLYFGFYQSS